MLTRRPSARRPGFTIVEATLVLSIAMLFLFGILEYARYLFLLQVVENAAREGARYAIARTGDGTTLSQVQGQIKGYLSGRDKELKNYKVEILNVDPSTGITVPGTQWNDAPFGGAILVRVQGDYAPILPTFLHRQAVLKIRATAMMTSEAN